MDRVAMDAPAGCKTLHEFADAFIGISHPRLIESGPEEINISDEVVVTVYNPARPGTAGRQATVTY